ncbi:response regulator transcription factor [Nocardioides sp. AX2bis]|uniref:response regulator transcription factor n=1 Tax=Nocardioides sp. AX2bis TaxID=2653157 RepID=UPI0012F32056|nr:response regulator transcription factor [Nocardioides sp. AX2bis]VXB48190.1 DNA-binding response regulator, OmpR family, contains REC and winged-helix (WHTH) domain [Nocardioides sp. AX2bis]
MSSPSRPTGQTGPGEGESSPAVRRVLVVDDHADQREVMGLTLVRAGFAVETASSGEEAVETVRRLDPDLITLDVSMPGIDGIETCRRIRDFSDAYVIMVTSRDAELDRLLGLEVGADDYLVKPCSPRELVARAAALLRRPRQGVARSVTAPEAVTPPGTDRPGQVAPPAPDGPGPGVLDAGGGLMLHPVRHVALLDGQPLPLTPSEVDLLVALLQPPLRTWWRAELVREMWHGDFMESDFLVDVHVASLRRKLKRAAPGRDWIQTVDGSGYRYAPGT